MGQAASNPNAAENLPDIIEESVAQEFLGECFRRAEWESLSMGTGSVHKDNFLQMLSDRNFPPSFRAWLEFWRIHEVMPKLTELGVEDPVGLCQLTEEQIGELNMKPVQKRHYQMALVHAAYLSKIGLDKPFSPLGARRVGEVVTGSIDVFPNLDNEVDPNVQNEAQKNIIVVDGDGKEEAVPVEPLPVDVVSEQAVEAAGGENKEKVTPLAQTETEAVVTGAVVEEEVNPVVETSGVDAEQEAEADKNVNADVEPTPNPSTNEAPATPEKQPLAAPAPDCPPSPGGSGLSAARALSTSPSS
eukprot:CAMPEP_0114361140 /NCGR_PEP_ID=MMETSP0101-20121206/24459_1 /TAXON_ID=38822 ORGANISM="Pteridomonas danica, Strain PT" /NCGR_SAMPLE_ID=MMETSP0101 /ASSEMBLY_ACC=CAM_ASM_000211 /LENGTH=301 /DNA_ID=CAMNT_0001505865 /DNA_START=88 /DNA_END=993 /DNA_ORIENTATION=-